MPTGSACDPAMRWIVGGHAVTKQAASSSQMGPASEHGSPGHRRHERREALADHERCVDRTGFMTATRRSEHHSRHGLQASARPTCDQEVNRLQRTLRLHLLQIPCSCSSPVRRCGTVVPCVPVQRPQRFDRLGKRVEAWLSFASRGRNLRRYFRGDTPVVRLAGALRIPRSRGLPVRNPSTKEPDSGRKASLIC